MIFKSRKQTAVRVERLEEQVTFLENHYWDLHERHMRLLRHLDLYECLVRPSVELRTRVGKEPSNEEN